MEKETPRPIGPGVVVQQVLSGDLEVDLEAALEDLQVAFVKSGWNR